MRERVAERVVAERCDEAEPQRLVDVDRAAGEQEVARRALTDEQREPPDVRAGSGARRACRRGSRSARVGRGDAEVARDRELHAGAERGTVDRRDHRRRVVDDRVERLLERGTERVDDRVAARPRRRSASTRSAPAQNAVPAPVITTARRSRLPVEVVAQLVAELAVERVAALRAVDRRDTDARRCASKRITRRHDSSMSAMRSPSCTRLLGRDVQLADDTRHLGDHRDLHLHRLEDARSRRPRRPSGPPRRRPARRSR